VLSECRRGQKDVKHWRGVGEAAGKCGHWTQATWDEVPQEQNSLEAKLS